MTLKIVIGASLALSTFLLGSLLIFGLAGNTTFSLLYMLFVITFAAASVWALRRMFESRLLLLMLILIAITFSSAAVFAASSAKDFAAASKELQVTGQKLQNEITYTSQKNSYYTQYADYYSAQIAENQKTSQDLETQITAISGELLAPPPAPQQVLPQEPVLPAQDTLPTQQQSSWWENGEWEDD